MQCCSQANLNRTVACRLCPSCHLSKVPSEAAKLADSLVSNGRDRNYWSCQVHKILILIQAHKVTTFNAFLFSDKPDLHQGLTHQPSHFFKTKRDRSDFSLDWFVPYWLRSAKSWFHTVLNLSSQLFLRLNARNIAKNQQLAIFPRKCLALPCCSISPPSFHRKLKLAFGCWKSVCCSFRLLKVRLLISVLKRIVSVNEFLPLSLKVKVSKRYNELKRF